MHRITLSFNSAVVMLQLHCCVHTGQKQRWYEQLEIHPEEEYRRSKPVCFLGSFSRKTESVRFF